MTFTELYATHQASGGTLSERQFRFKLNYDVRKGRMLKLGRDDFEPTESSSLKPYSHAYSLLSRSIAEELTSLGLRFNIFETRQLDEFGVDLGENRVFVSVERGRSAEISDFASRRYPGFKVFVRDFVTEAPAGGKRNWQARPELWFVDLISDKALLSLVNLSERHKIFNSLVTRYALDVSKMRRYARRRTTIEQMNAFLSYRAKLEACGWEFEDSVLSVSSEAENLGHKEHKVHKDLGGQYE